MVAFALMALSFYFLMAWVFGSFAEAVDGLLHRIR